MRNAVLGHAMTFAEADGGVVNDSIEAPERVDLCGEVFRRGDGAELADRHRFRLGRGFLCVRGAGIVARVQDDLMSLVGEKLPDHQAKAIGRTGDEDARHAVAPNVVLGNSYRSLSAARSSRLQPESGASRL